MTLSIIIEFQIKYMPILIHFDMNFSELKFTLTRFESLSIELKVRLSETMNVRHNNSRRE